MDAWEARMLVSLLAATVGINVGYTETAAGAVDHVLTGGSSAQAATHTCVPCGRRTSFALTRHGPGAAVESKPVLGRLVACEADLPGWQESEGRRSPALLLSDNP